MKPQYKLGDRVEFIMTREEANFDRACDAAIKHALHRFGVTEDGHFSYVQGAERSTDSINIEFVSYACTGGMAGWCHVYTFAATVEREE